MRDTFQKDDVVKLRAEVYFDVNTFEHFTFRSGSIGLVKSECISNTYNIEFDITPMFSITVNIHSSYLERVGTKSEVLDGSNFEAYKGNLSNG